MTVTGSGIACVLHVPNVSHCENVLAEHSPLIHQVITQLTFPINRSALDGTWKMSKLEHVVVMDSSYIISTTIALQKLRDIPRVSNVFRCGDMALLGILLSQETTINKSVVFGWHVEDVEA